MFLATILCGLPVGAMTAAGFLLGGIVAVWLCWTGRIPMPQKVPDKIIHLPGDQP